MDVRLGVRFPIELRAQAALYINVCLHNHNNRQLRAPLLGIFCCAVCNPPQERVRLTTTNTQTNSDVEI